MRYLRNTHRNRGLTRREGLAQGTVIADPHDAQALFARCPVADTTPLLAAPELARAVGVGELWLKDERARMGLGSFKALGAAHAIARLAADRLDAPGTLAGADTLADASATALAGTTFVCASAGNHGLSVAAGARVFGADAVIHVSRTVPESFVARLRAKGARVVRSGDDYEASMAAAAADADAHGWVLLSDSSWPGYVELPTRVMEGYLILAAEAAEQIPQAPTHVFLQAGVGGLAAAVTAFVRRRWGDGPVVVVVEPEAAPALLESIDAGAPVCATGPVSTMGRLDCKEPSHLALAELARHADHFVTITDDECDRTVALLAQHGIDTTPSGAAGVAGLHHAGQHRDALGLTGDSRVLAIITEGVPEGPEPPARLELAPVEPADRPGEQRRNEHHRGRRGLQQLGGGCAGEQIGGGTQQLGGQPRLDRADELQDRQDDQRAHRQQHDGDRLSDQAGGQRDDGHDEDQVERGERGADDDIHHVGGLDEDGGERGGQRSTHDQPGDGTDARPGHAGHHQLPGGARCGCAGTRPSRAWRRSTGRRR